MTQKHILSLLVSAALLCGLLACLLYTSRQVMRDVLVYPDHGALRSEEQAFIDLLHREAVLILP